MLSLQQFLGLLIDGLLMEYQINRKGNEHLCSDCPLACKHLAQEITDGGGQLTTANHPIELFARAYGLS